MLNLEEQEFRVKGVYDNIEEASSIKQQKMYWLNENNVEGHISSYIELMCTLLMILISTILQKIRLVV
ncbi:hypothetical protein [uncultured Campylobacter sp.]|uniref:hypothetical protein n=1 Tax=uncultured Campylobacter sp. TaxID=218934 RepID=UPI00261A35AF|nr:hypothetical protein [uncultured Campylobacter sp.]